MVIVEVNSSGKNQDFLRLTCLQRKKKTRFSLRRNQSRFPSGGNEITFKDKIIKFSHFHRDPRIRHLSNVSEKKRGWLRYFILLSLKISFTNGSCEVEFLYIPIIYNSFYFWNVLEWNLQEKCWSILVVFYVIGVGLFHSI